MSRSAANPLACCQSIGISFHDFQRNTGLFEGVVREIGRLFGMPIARLLFRSPDKSVETQADERIIRLTVHMFIGQ